MYQYKNSKVASVNNVTTLHTFSIQLATPPTNIISINNCIIIVFLGHISIFVSNNPPQIILHISPNDIIFIRSNKTNDNSKTKNQNSNVSSTSLSKITPGNNLNFSELYQKTYAKVFKKIICSTYFPSRDTITGFHNSSVGSTQIYICNTIIQRDICQYSFKFYSRFNSETQKEIISYKKYSIHASSFLHNIAIDIFFSYHTYFFV